MIRITGEISPAMLAVYALYNLKAQIEEGELHTKTINAAIDVFGDQD